jgi:hypothetical protein
MVGGQKGNYYDSTRKIPAIFSKLSEARDSLASHWHVSSYPTRNIWDPTSEKLPAVPQAGAWETKSMSILARWSSAYDAYLNIQGDNLTDTKRKGTAALCILKELGSTSKMLSRTRVNDERDWDVFCPMFQKIVSLAEDIVNLDRISDPLNPKKFCIDMAIVGPLFKVSILSYTFLRLQRVRKVALVNSRTCVLTLTLSRSPVVVEILLSAGEQSRFFKTVVGQKENGMLS